MELVHNRSRTAFQAIWLIAAGSVLLLLCAPLALTQEKNPLVTHPATAHPAAALAQISRVIVPDVRGRTPADAQALLERAGLRAGRMLQSEGPGAAGTVWRQDPPGGSVVVQGTPVSFYVVPRKSPPAPSHGDEEFSRMVPSLIGRTQDQAIEFLGRINLKLGKVTEGEGTGAEGTIYAQDPQPGQWVRVPSSVNVQVVRPRKAPGGSEEIPWRIVPSLRGQTAKAAQQVLAQSGLRMGNVSSGYASAPMETIYAQDPVANSRVRSGTNVNIWVAEVRTQPPPHPASQSQPTPQPQPAPKTQTKPTPIVPVPNLIHRDFNSAATFLEHSKLRLGQVGHQESDTNIGLITSQSPEPGTRVEVGTPVNVAVAQERSAVVVPDVVKRDEGSAASILGRAGLQMGAVTQKDSDESSGTVLSQKPAAGTSVRNGSSVNIIVSHQIIHQLIVMADNPNPEVGKPVKFHAHVFPEEGQFTYQFTFGDGTTSGWTPKSVVTHIYPAPGRYQVEAIATLGATRVQSESVQVTSKDASFIVSFEASPTRARPRDKIAFTAKIDRADIYPSYQFVFADGTTSEWSEQPVILHSYEHRGTYPVKVLARVMQGRIAESTPKEVDIGRIPLTAWTAIGAGVLALGGGVFFYRGWQQFRKWVRVVPKLDAGEQRVRIESGEGWGESVRLRVVRPPGEHRILWAAGSEPGKAAVHD